MANTVGQKGQVVIEKEIRKKLGIEPGWVALQKLSGNHVELYFIPPKHNRSLKGSLSEYTTVLVSESDWHETVDAALAREAKRKVSSRRTP
jgi:AbrB family looped-hinge helix DNA binding protein